MILGILLVLIGIFFPRDWYDTLPKQEDLPAPSIKGVTLFQYSIVIEGLLFIWISLKRWTLTRTSEANRLSITAVSEDDELISKQIALWLLAAITLLAFILRLVNLNLDLWLDEITPIMRYRHFSALQVVGSYLSSNNHLFNTLLLKITIAVFGEKEWSIRLPAVIFGTATIPAIYWVARIVMTRLVSLSIALLLAVSYHHIFFSQNAKGYSAYLFFSLLSSGLLVKGLQMDLVRIWIFYIITMFFNFASLLNSVFVFISHIFTSGVFLLILSQRGAFPMLLLRRLTGVFLVTGLLGFQLYSLILPQAYEVIHMVYTNLATGYRMFSWELLKEIIRGISAGFGSGILFGVLPFLIVSIVGFVALFKRQWVLIMSLTMPGIFMALYLIVKSLTFSPRHFLIILPLVIISAVNGIFIVAKFVAKPLRKNEKIFTARVGIALLLIVCIISLASLKYYYSTPKQAYRSSIKYLEAKRKPGEIVIVIHIAEAGYRYYGERLGINLNEGKDYFFVRTIESFNEVFCSHGKIGCFLVTTFPRALNINHPDLEERIKKDWTVIKTFPGTIGDGQISVWKKL